MFSKDTRTYVLIWAVDNLGHLTIITRVRICAHIGPVPITKFTMIFWYFEAQTRVYIIDQRNVGSLIRSPFHLAQFSIYRAQCHLPPLRTLQSLPPVSRQPIWMPLLILFANRFRTPTPSQIISASRSVCRLISKHSSTRSWYSSKKSALKIPTSEFHGKSVDGR